MEGDATPGLERQQVKGHWVTPGGEAVTMCGRSREPKQEALATGPRIGSRGGGHGKCDGQEGSPERLLRMSGDGCGQVKGAS